MKHKFRLLTVLVLGTTLSIAQSSKRTTAKNALEDFKTYKDGDALKKAKENIDAAAQHPETGIEAKTWSYRGDIYLISYENALRVEGEKQKDVTDAAKKSAIAYTNTSVSDLTTAYESYLKVKQYDKKNIYMEAAKAALIKIELDYDNKGLADFNAKKTAEAAAEFQKAYEVSQLNGRPDTSALNNAGLSYRAGGDMANAKATFQKLVDMDFGKAKTITFLATMLLKDNDTATASNVIRKGRAKYPNDMDLLTTETDYFLKRGKNQEAINDLKLVIQKKPNDPHIYMVAGSLYDKMAFPKDASDKPLAKPANFTEYYNQCESNYKKAIELKPDYFEALFNLGALYYNEAAVHYNNGNTMKDAGAAAKEGKLAEEYFKKALPYLEKAHELDPKDMATMQSLKKLYAKTEQQSKYDKIVAEMKGN
jgi:tetratricopeptide (TPR) repeat protein